jgi:hypothetical protein
LTNSNGKTEKESNLVHIVKKTFLRQKVQNKKQKENKLIARKDWNFEIHSVKFESYLFMSVIVVRRWTRPSLVSNMMGSIAMCQERSFG